MINNRFKQRCAALIKNVFCNLSHSTTLSYIVEINVHIGGATELFKNVIE